MIDLCSHSVCVVVYVHFEYCLLCCDCWLQCWYCIQFEAHHSISEPNKILPHIELQAFGRIIRKWKFDFFSKDSRLFSYSYSLHFCSTELQNSYLSRTIKEISIILYKMFECCYLTCSVLTYKMWIKHEESWVRWCNIRYCCYNLKRTWLMKNSENIKQKTKKFPKEGKLNFRENTMKLF